MFQILLVFCDSPEKWQLDFQDPASPVIEGIINLHNDVIVFLILVFFIVFTCFFTLSFFKSYYKKNNSYYYNPTTHNTFLEFVWTIIPALILVLIAIPSFSLIYSLDDLISANFSFKVIGHQWYWSYEYPIINTNSFVTLDTDITVNSYELNQYDYSSDALNSLIYYGKSFWKSGAAISHFHTLLRLCKFGILTVHSFTYHHILDYLCFSDETKNNLSNFLIFRTNIALFFDTRRKDFLLKSACFFDHSFFARGYWKALSGKVTIANYGIYSVQVLDGTKGPDSNKIIGAQVFPKELKQAIDSLLDVKNFKVTQISDFIESIPKEFSFDSYIINEEDLLLGSFRLLEVDNRVVLPLKTHIRIIVTSADVVHSWAVPSLGIKIDACPGRLNQVATYINRPGVFYGQCSELCGVNHGFIPIVVEVVSTTN